MTVVNPSYEDPGQFKGLAQGWAVATVSTEELFADFGRNPSVDDTSSQEDFEQGWTTQPGVPLSRVQPFVSASVVADLALVDAGDIAPIDSELTVEVSDLSGVTSTETRRYHTGDDQGVQDEFAGFTEDLLRAIFSQPANVLFESFSSPWSIPSTKTMPIAQGAEKGPPLDTAAGDTTKLPPDPEFVARNKVSVTDFIEVTLNFVPVTQAIGASADPPFLGTPSLPTSPLITSIETVAQFMAFDVVPEPYEDFREGWGAMDFSLEDPTEFVANDLVFAVFGAAPARDHEDFEAEWGVPSGLSLVLATPVFAEYGTPEGDKDFDSFEFFREITAAIQFADAVVFVPNDWLAHATDLDEPVVFSDLAGGSYPRAADGFARLANDTQFFISFLTELSAPTQFIEVVAGPISGSPDLEFADSGTQGITIQINPAKYWGRAMTTL